MRSNANISRVFTIAKAQGENLSLDMCSTSLLVSERVLPLIQLCHPSQTLTLFAYQRGSDTQDVSKVAWHSLVSCLDIANELSDLEVGVLSLTPQYPTPLFRIHLAV